MYIILKNKNVGNCFNYGKIVGTKKTLRNKQGAWCVFFEELITGDAWGPEQKGCRGNVVDLQRTVKYCSSNSTVYYTWDD